MALCCNLIPASPSRMLLRCIAFVVSWVAEEEQVLPGICQTPPPSTLASQRVATLDCVGSVVRGVFPKSFRCIVGLPKDLSRQVDCPLQYARFVSPFATMTRRVYYTVFVGVCDGNDSSKRNAQLWACGLPCWHEVCLDPRVCVHAVAFFWLLHPQPNHSSLPSGNL